jgi:hypothetical protein
MRRLALACAVVAAVGAGAPACSDSGGSKEAFCEQIAQVPSFRSIFDTYDPADPAAARAQLNAAVEQLHALQDAAPGEVRDDVETVADVAERLVKALGEIDPADPLSGLEGLDNLQADFDAVEEASTNVATYTQSQCGITLDTAPPTTPLTTPTTATG